MSAAVAAPAARPEPDVHSGDYQLRNQIRGAYAWEPVPGDSAAERYVGRRAAIRPGGYSLAIPVSLITRSYLAS